MVSLDLVSAPRLPASTRTSSYQPRGSDVSPAAQAPPLVTESHAFPSVPHPYGNITLSVRYLTNPHFQLDELESLLSSRFFSLDEGADFTPTLVKNQQRESLSSSPGSLPLRTSLPASPPTSTSLADRTARPPIQPSQTNPRTTSFPSSSISSRLPPLQVSRAGMATDSAHSSASSRLEIPAFPTTNTRLRRESMGSVRLCLHLARDRVIAASLIVNYRIFHLFPGRCRFVVHS